MTLFADTSFLCALLHQQTNTVQAGAVMDRLAEPPAAYELAVAAGKFAVQPCDWPSVHQRARELSARHASRLGCRTLDTLHVATALVLGAREFLSFDAGQRTLAQAEGLVLPV